LPIYSSETNRAVAASESLISGLTYYIKLDDVWAALPAAVQSTIGNGIQINVTASTTIGGTILSNTASLTLRKLTLFPLS